MKLENVVIRLVNEADKSRFLTFFDECFKAEYSPTLDALAPDGVYNFTSEFLESIFLPQDDQHMFEAVLPDNKLVATGVGVERENRFYIWGM